MQEPRPAGKKIDDRKNRQPEAGGKADAQQESGAGT